MGCGPSKTKERRGSYASCQRLERHKISAAYKLDTRSKDLVVKQFKSFQNFNENSNEEEGSRFEDKMDFEQFAQLMPNISRDILALVFRVFDANSSGRVSTREFLLTIALLTEDCQTPAQQLDACFTMFDTDSDGLLSQGEFDVMIRTAVNISLASFLEMDEGKAAMEAQLAKEYSEENLLFWNQAVAYRELPAEERAAMAARMIDEYVREGSVRQVNIPSAEAKKILETYNTSKAKLTTMPEDLFLGAEEEVLSLMERDTFSRLKADPEAMTKLVDSFWSAADLNCDGKIMFHEYRKWALSSPQMLSFFSGLQQSICRIFSEPLNPPTQ